MGFKRAGFQILGGVESNQNAALTYTKNLFPLHEEKLIKKHGQARDIRTYTPEMFAEEFIENDFVNNIDVIIGGPPCQAFSRIGRAKLREIMDHQEAHLNDHRSNLYIHFLSFVSTFKPSVVLMENVPEILNYGDQNVAEEIALSLKDLGYRTIYSVLNLARYGIPQSRVRFFLLAFREDLGILPQFPEPSHAHKTKNNMYYYPMNGKYDASDISQLSLLDDQIKFRHYIKPKQQEEILKPAINVQQAIGDLPFMSTDDIGPSEARRNFSMKAYSRGRPSFYATKMRNWPGFETKNGVTGNAFRYLPRDHEIFRKMEHGDQYPEAHDIATGLFSKRRYEYKQKYGTKLKKGSEEYKKIKQKIVPPYSTEKFPNKWQKLDPEKPAHTITAHLGKDTYSHIHYDNDQARVISVREAARLQSFPDGFKFPHALSHAYRQIGNAVPPLFAYQLARSIRKQLKQAI